MRLKLCLVHWHVDFCRFCVIKVVFLTIFFHSSHFREVLNLRLERSDFLFFFQHVETRASICVCIILALAVPSIIPGIDKLCWIQILLAFLEGQCLTLRAGCNNCCEHTNWVWRKNHLIHSVCLLILGRFYCTTSRDRDT